MYILFDINRGGSGHETCARTVSGVKSQGSRWSVEVDRRLSALRRRLGRDAGPFRPARGLALDSSWVPAGLASFGVDRAVRVGVGSVLDVHGSGSADVFRRAVQRYSAVADDASCGLSVEERARRLVRAAACGTPVVSVGSDLAGVLPASVATVLGGVSVGELADPEVAMRVAFNQWSAVFDHLVLPTAWVASAPTVSITIASHRPQFVTRWLPQIARQTHSRLQVVAALHADGFTEADRDLIRRTLGERGIDAVIVDAPPSLSLGATLDLARRRADGDVILKWDDDDLYSSNHVIDLLRARHYSRAPLVGKACDFVYLGSRDLTVQRHQADRESFSPTLSGNTLMIDRDALDAVGGWSDVSLGEDASLIARVRRAGGFTYRTAGFGMIAVRQAQASQHTWNLDEVTLVDGAVRTCPGLALDAALVDVPSEISDAVRRSAAGER